MKVFFNIALFILSHLIQNTAIIVLLFFITARLINIKARPIVLIILGAVYLVFTGVNLSTTIITVKTYKSAMAAAYGNASALADAYIENITSNVNEMRNKMEVLELDHLLSRSVLGDAAGIDEMRKKLTHAEEALDDYGKSFSQSAHLFCMEVENMDIPEAQKTEVLSRVEKSIDTSAEIVNGFINIERQLLSAIDGLLSYLEDKQGDYLIDNNEIVFFSNEDYTECSSLLDGIEELIESEKAYFYEKLTLNPIKDS